MIRLAISVEGETEEDFVKYVLKGHLQAKGVDATPILPDGKGGDIRISRLAPEMAKLVFSFEYVTSLVDFYGFRDRSTNDPDELEIRIEKAVRGRIHQAWDESRLFAYVQRHEFEALVFSDVTSFGGVFDDLPDGTLAELGKIRSHFNTPEDINDSSITAPGKRICRLIPGYRKRVHGPELAIAIGLTVIRSECPRFNEWLTRLESLGG